MADRINILNTVLTPPDGNPVDVIESLRQLYYDLAGTPLPRALPALLNLVSPDRLLYGSDYPFTGADGVAFLASALSDPTVDDKLKPTAFRLNAQALFPRLAGSRGNEALPGLGRGPGFAPELL